MAQSILLKRSSVAGNVPDSSDLSLGEIAINTADGAVYVKKGNNDIVAVHDNDILHIDTTNSRIGIGTTSPGYSLDVHSGTNDWPIRGISSDAKAGIVLADNNTANYIMSQSYTLSLGNQPSLHASNLNIKSTGNVGIGTTAPETKLHVANGSDTSPAVIITGGHNGRRLKIQSYQTGGAAGAGFIFNADSSYGALKFQTTSTDRMVITQPGNVGIGISTNIDSNLHVADGTAQINIEGTSGDAILKLESTGNSYWNIFNDESDARKLKFEDNGNGVALTIARDGKVGIGTTNPLATLDVVRGGTTGLSSVNARTALLVQNNLSNGTVLSINAKSTGYSGIFLGDQDNEAICQIQYVHTDDKLKFLTNGGGYNPLTISGQNVGIGTSSPAQTFTVEKNSGIFRINTSTSTYPRIEVGSASGTTAAIINRTTATQNIIFGETSDTGNYSFRGGNVGIGTTSPDTTLDVTSDGVHGIILNQDTDNSSASGRIFFKSTQRTNTILNVSGNLEFRTGATIGSSSGTVRMTIVGSSGAVKFNNAYTFPTADGSANQVLKTDGSGNLTFATIAGASGGTSISDSDGDTKIQVEESSDEDKIRFDTAGTQRMLLDNTGKLAVGGNQDPVYPLDLRNPSDSNQIFRVLFPDAATTQIGTSRMASGATQGLFIEGQTGVRFGVSGTEYARLHSNGNFGIGTTAPAVNLHILESSNSTTPQFRITNDTPESLTMGVVRSAAGTAPNTAFISFDNALRFIGQTGTTNERMRITEGGSVGIGTDAPGEKLDVNGSVKIRETGVGNGLLLHTNSGITINSNLFQLWSGQTSGFSFHANSTGDGSSEKVRITAAGNVGIGTTSPSSFHANANNLVVGSGSGTEGITINSGAANYGVIYFADGTSGSAAYAGSINYNHGDNSMRLGTAGSTTSAIIDSSGNLLVGTTNAANASAGFRAYAGGNGAFTRASTVLDLNRLSTDGVIIQFQKDTVNVGSIGTVSNGKLMMGVGGSSGTNLIFADAFDEIYPSQNGVTTLGDPGSKFKDLHLSGNANIGGNAVITGDLTVNGSTTTLNVATLDVEDKNITLNKGSGDTSGSANGAGITIQDAVDASTDASMTWNNSSNLFSFSNKVDVQGDLQAYNIYAQDYHVLNSAGNGWHEWATRSDDRVNLSVHDISTNGTVGIGTAATSDSLRILQSGTNASAVYATDGTSWLRVVPNLGGGGFNPIVSTGDIGLIFSTDNDTSTNTSGALVLAPHSNTIGGIKIREDGRVGIGTAAPSTTFHVLNATTNGEVMRLTTTGDNPDRNMYFQSDHIYSDGSFYLGSGSHRNLYRGSYHTFHYGSSNTEAMRVHTDGNVGIGTSSPSAKLDVRSSADPADGTLMFLRNDVSSGNGAFIRYDVNNVGDWAIGIPDNRNAFTIWKDQGNTGTEYFTVNSNGNVGIGTNNPQFDLDVTGLLRVTSDAYLQGDVYVNSKIRHNGDVDNYITFSAADTQGFITGNSTRLQITNSLVRFNQENNNQDFSVYSANSDNMLYVDASTDRVGIGTATPSKPLHIQFSGDHGARIESEDNHASLYIDSHTAYGQYIRFSENNANKYWIQSTGGKLVFRPGATSTVANQVTFDSTGKVGIGTASLTNKFHVSGDARIEGSLMAGGAAASNVPARPIHVKSAGDAAAIRIEDTTSSNKAYDIRSTHGEGLHFVDVTGGTTPMTIHTNGNVSVGAPSAQNGKLHVNGNFRVGPYYSADDRDGFLLIPHGTDTRLQSNNERFHIENGSGNILITASGVVQVGEYAIDTTSTSSTATTQIAIHTFAAATFRSARFTVQVTNSTDSTYHTSELLLVHNGTTANITEFGEIHTGSAVEATFDADINSGNVRLLATPASTDTMAFKVVCHSITT